MADGFSVTTELACVGPHYSQPLLLELELCGSGAYEILM